MENSPFKKTPKTITRPMTTNTGLTDTEYVVTCLSMCIEKLHYCHHNTTSFAQHKAFDFAYKEINKLKDEIVEKTIGYTGERYSKVNLVPIEGNVQEMGKMLPQEIQSFVRFLKNFGETNNYCGLEALADEVGEVGAKLNYLLTLV